MAIDLIRDGSFFRTAQPVFCPLLGVEVPACVYTGGAEEVHPDQSDALDRFLAIDPIQQRALLFEPLFAD